MSEDTEQPQPSMVGIQHVDNVVVGPNSRQINHYWRDPRMRALIIASTVLVIVAVGVSTTLLWPKPARAALELAAVEVALSHEINGDTFSLADPVPTAYPGSIAATPVDITLKNNGMAPALITAIKAEVVYAEQLEDCYGGTGGVSYITANYGAKFPVPVPSRPFALESNVRFEVKGGAVDRFTFSLGPERQSKSPPEPYLIAARLSLVHDKADQALDLGTVAIATDVKGLNRQADQPTDRQCIEKNAAKMDQLYAIQATRAKELDYLRGRYAEMTHVDSTPAERSCQEWKQESAVSSLCAKYTRQELFVAMTLKQQPVPDRSLYIVRLDTSDPAQRYRLLLRPRRAEDNSSTEWHCSGIVPDKGPASVAFRPCSLHGSAQLGQDNTLTVTTTLDPWFTFQQFKVKVETRDHTPTGDYVTTSTTPDDSPVAVRRGT
ncbi:hypothetical protein IU459_16150 [Nocardia amamiensis]|uniref:Uncharacterized protein n=1 Tax=Nocardia amamiensis TaxID=404578 RepID=A0ABS0CR42_9NOCA|nr:hypothetical protein [Nocardia amamiensis]MBF6299062.1 hypothetical protein [Nocardia amamiensis]